MRLRKYIAVFSILLGSVTSNHACEWGIEYEDVRFLILNPNIINNDAWINFYYTSHLYYSTELISYKDEKILVAEWKTKLGLTSSEESILVYLFNQSKGDPATLDAVKKEFYSKPQWKSFMEYAKSCESSMNVFDPWETIYNDSLVKAREGLIKKGMDKINSQKEEFWQKKYAFQLLKLAFYNEQTDLFNQLYNKYFGYRKEKGPMDWWATHYKSMMLERKGVLDSANYLHAMVYAHSTNKMYISHQMYSANNFEQQLPLASGDMERSYLYIFKALHNYTNAVEDISTAYKLYPSNHLIPLALTREINKIEATFGSENYDYKQYYFNEDSGNVNINEFAFHVHQLYEEVKQMPQLKKDQPDYYYLVVAHLAIMNRDVATANSSLDQITETDPSIAYQKRVLSVMLHMISNNIQTEASREFIGEQLEQLIKNKSGRFESQKILFSLISYIQNAYASKGNYTYSFLLKYIAEEKFCYSCYRGSFHYSVISDLDAKDNEDLILSVINLVEKKNKNRLEKVLTLPYPNSQLFWELLGTVYLRHNKVEKSSEAFHKIPSESWELFLGIEDELPENPFVLSSLKNYDVEMETFTKTEITDSLLYFGNKENKTSTDYHLLGNAWFNFSKFGNSWYMLDYYREGSFNFFSDWYEERKEEGIRWKLNTLALTNSIRYYTAALPLCKSPEEKAEVLYMVAECYYLLNKKQEYIKWATEYERMQSTSFYQVEKCLYSRSIKDPEKLDKIFDQSWY